VASVGEGSRLAQSGTLGGRELGNSFDGLSIGWLRCVRIQQPHRAGFLNHPVPQNQGIDDVAAGHTPPSPHPHRDAAFSDIKQMIADHKTFTLGASHRTSWTGVDAHCPSPLKRSKGNAIAFAHRLAGFFAES